MYLESDTTGENFEDRITKHNSHQKATTTYTSHKDEDIVAPPLKMNDTFTLSNSVLCDTLQNIALYEVLHHIFGSILQHIFSQISWSGTCLSLHTRDISTEIFPPT